VAPQYQRIPFPCNVSAFLTASTFEQPYAGHPAQGRRVIRTLSTFCQGEMPFNVVGAQRCRTLIQRDARWCPENPMSLTMLPIHVSKPRDPEAGILEGHRIAGCAGDTVPRSPIFLSSPKKLTISSSSCRLVIPKAMWIIAREFHQRGRP